MTYQELLNVLGQNQNAFAGIAPTSVNAPSIDQIIAGISNQYQPLNAYAPQGSMLGGASRYLSEQPSFGAIEMMPEYGRTLQSASPSFVPAAFDRNVYGNVNTQTLSDLISQLNSGGGFGGDSGPTSSSPSSSSGVSSGTGASTGIGGFSISPSGMATPNSVSQAAATVAGMATGLPLGFLASINNAAANAAALGFNTAISDTMGINANNTSPAAVSAAQAANGMSGTTGGSAAAVGAAAAAAAAAAGHSDAAIGAAAQAAASAAIGGASAAAAAAAAADAAASVDGGTTGPGSASGIGVGSSSGISGMDAMSDAASSGVSGSGTASGVSGVGVGSSDGVNGMDASSDAAGSSDGGGSGGGGGKIICTKLHELGLMPTNIYEADQAFGRKLVSESPETYYGYVRWAQHIVNLMNRNDFVGKTAIFCSYHIATPWSVAMAEEMGQPVKASWFGKFLMKRGLQFCKLVAPKNKQMVLS